MQMRIRSMLATIVMIFATASGGLAFEYHPRDNGGEQNQYRFKLYGFPPGQGELQLPKSMSVRLTEGPTRLVGLRQLKTLHIELTAQGNLQGPVFRELPIRLEYIGQRLLSCPEEFCSPYYQIAVVTLEPGRRFDLTITGSPQAVSALKTALQSGHAALYFDRMFFVVETTLVLGVTFNGTQGFERDIPSLGCPNGDFIDVECPRFPYEERNYFSGDGCVSNAPDPSRTLHAVLGALRFEGEVPSGYVYRNQHEACRGSGVRPRNALSIRDAFAMAVLNESILNDGGGRVERYLSSTAVLELPVSIAWSTLSVSGSAQ